MAKHETSPSIFVSSAFVAIRESFIALLPVVVVMNIFVLGTQLFSYFASQGYQLGWQAYLEHANLVLRFGLPICLLIALSSFLAKQKNLDRTVSVLIALLCFAQSVQFSYSADGSFAYSGASILRALFTAFLTIHLLAYFHKFAALRLVGAELASPALANVINNILPAFISMCCFISLDWLLGLFSPWFERGLVYWFSGLQHVSQTGQLVLYEVVQQIAWFLGLHGGYIAQDLFSLLKLETTHTGLAQVFMAIGGPGSTLGLLLAILIFSRCQQHLAIAKISLPFSLFNINEVLIFGLPIVFNPTMLLPFILAPLASMYVAMAALDAGLFSLNASVNSWLLPPFLSAYLLSSGSINAVLVQAFCVLLSIIIYYPFIQRLSRQYDNHLRLRQAFTGGSRSYIAEALQSVSEQKYVQAQNEQQLLMQQTQEVMELLEGGELMLYFQPKVNIHTGEVVAAEALLRLRQQDGAISGPSFLPLLYKLGLSKAIDEKVLALALAQLRQWQQDDIEHPLIWINFDKDFLLDEACIDRFIAALEQGGLAHSLAVEITEHTYTQDQGLLLKTIERFQAQGILVAIDDFGAGYSSLTTLTSIKADEVKLDRALVAPDNGHDSRSETLLRHSIEMCLELGFNVIAEGVEQQSELELLKKYGVEIVQGYLTGRPMPADKLLQHSYAPELFQHLPCDEAKVAEVSSSQLDDFIEHQTENS